MLSESTSEYQRLKDPTWPDEHVPRKMVPQPMIKQRIRHDLQQEQHENQHPNNILNGYQPSQVLNYQLAELTQINKNLSIGISKQPEDSLTQVDTGTTFVHRQHIHVEPRAS